MTAWAMRSSKTASDGFACGFSDCSALEDGASCSLAEASVDAEARGKPPIQRPHYLSAG